jgi:alpha-ketoglutarate-dependent taurine dioxygenase
MGNSGFGVEPLAATFGAVVTDIDLRDLNERTHHELYAAWIEYGLLIFPGQFLERDEQDRWARFFGELEFTASPIANLDKDGNIHSADDDDVVKAIRGNQGWHHDSTYMPVQAKGAVFTAEIIPSHGGATGFADMRAAYQALDADTQQRVRTMKAYHSLYYSMDRVGLLPTATDDAGRPRGYGYHVETPCLRPLVKDHPETGLPNLLIGRHAHHIEGMEPAESEQFLDQLCDEACSGDRVYHHQWSVGDAVLWDNRRLMHRATPYDMNEPRRMWHTRIAGDPVSELALNHQISPISPS